MYIITYNYIVLHDVQPSLHREYKTNYFSNPFSIFLWKYFISQILLQPPNLGKFQKKNPIINSMQIYNCSSSSIFVDSLVRAGQNIINPTIHVLYIVGIIVSCKRKLILHTSIETGYDNIYIKAT